MLKKESPGVTVRDVHQYLSIYVAERVSFGVHNVPNRNVPQTVAVNLAVELREGKEVR